jgi:D-alanyl-D-alanine carboxypeptidase
VRDGANTNRRLLSPIAGADGIKTGYTRAAGFNLVASAERGNERIIATVFGGRSGAARNARVAELLDLGFARAPTRGDPPARPAALRKPDAGRQDRTHGARRRHQPAPLPRPQPVAPEVPAEP